MGTHHPSKEQATAAQTKMERSVLNITYWDRKTNMWVAEKTKVTDVIEQVRRRTWTWAGHVSRQPMDTAYHPENHTNRKDSDEDRRDVVETNLTTTGRVPSGRG